VAPRTCASTAARTASRSSSSAVATAASNAAALRAATDSPRRFSPRGIGKGYPEMAERRDAKPRGAASPSVQLDRFS
jgi:hypothetical protein